MPTDNLRFLVPELNGMYLNLTHFFFSTIFEVIQVAGLSININLELLPQLLNRIEIWSLRGPFQKLDVGVLQRFLDNPNIGLKLFSCGKTQQ